MQFHWALNNAPTALQSKGIWLRDLSSCVSLYMAVLRVGGILLWEALRASVHGCLFPRIVYGQPWMSPTTIDQSLHFHASYGSAHRLQPVAWWSICLDVLDYLVCLDLNTTNNSRVSPRHSSWSCSWCLTRSYSFRALVCCSCSLGSMLFVFACSSTVSGSIPASSTVCSSTSS